MRVRDGHTGARQAGDIGFATCAVVPSWEKHAVIFAGEGDASNSFTRRKSRDNLRARRRSRPPLGFRPPPGLYSMQDVLGV